MFQFRLPGRLAGAVCLVAALLVVTGCGTASKPTGQVSGQVLYKDKPITDGEVHFVSKTGQGARANIDGSGNYIVKDALEATTYDVYVAPHPPGQAGPPGVGAAPKQAASLIPQKFRDSATSGLSFTVKEGKNEFKIELKD